MQINQVPFPINSLLANKEFEYSDTFVGHISNPKNEKITVEEIGKSFFTSSPKWIGLLMGLRNRIVKMFGLKTGESITEQINNPSTISLEKGKQLGIFRVFDRNEQEIILGENDKHLDFRVSLMVDQTKDQSQLLITTIVSFHNWFGKLYFLPVKPFHKIIVKSMLKRTILSLENKIR